MAEPDDLLKAHVERFNEHMRAHAKALQEQADKAAAELHAQQKEFLEWLKTSLNPSKLGDKPPDLPPAAG